MNSPTLAVRAAQFAADVLVGVLMIWVPYLVVVGTWRAARWLVTAGVPRGLFYLGLGVLLVFLGIYVAIRYALAHGPDLLSASADDGYRLVASAWSKVGGPARFVVVGTAALLALFAVVFTVCSAI